MDLPKLFPFIKTSPSALNILQIVGKWRVRIKREMGKTLGEESGEAV